MNAANPSTLLRGSLLCLEDSLKRLHLTGPLSWVGLARKAQDEQEARRTQVAEQLMLAEYYLEAEPTEASLKALACIAKAKGLLACVMLVGLLSISFDFDGDDLRRAKTRGRRAKEEMMAA